VIGECFPRYMIFIADIKRNGLLMDTLCPACPKVSQKIEIIQIMSMNFFSEKKYCGTM
jgi:hypothetical protein